MNSPAKARLNRTHTTIFRIAVLLAMSGFASTAFAQDAWDHTNAPRFQLLAPFGNQAVLDRETGLVWERGPGAVAAVNWSNAHERCNRLVVSNRMGWRVPTIQELTSILSIGFPNNMEPNNPFVLPPNNQLIWSSTASAINANNAWATSLLGPLVSNVPKTSLARSWCVRFRQGTDTQ